MNANGNQFSNEYLMDITSMSSYGSDWDFKDLLEREGEFTKTELDAYYDNPTEENRRIILLKRFEFHQNHASPYLN